MDEFLITRVIAETRASTVFEAEDIETGALVAIKAGKGDSNQVRNEIQLLATVASEFIIRPIASFVCQDDTPCLVLPFAAGGDLLTHVIKHGPMSEDACRTAFRRVLSAIEALHEQGIWHRDIKPDNLFFMGVEDEVVLADFGLARQFTQGETCEDIIGTHQYMAPEMHKGVPWNEKVDIWALGVTMFMCLTGEVPFSSDVDKDVIRQECIEGMPEVIRALKTEYDFISRDAKDLIIEMLHVDPAERISASQALQYRWFTLHF